MRPMDDIRQLRTEPFLTDILFNLQYMIFVGAAVAIREAMIPCSLWEKKPGALSLPCPKIFMLTIWRPRIVEPYMEPPFTRSMRISFCPVLIYDEIEPPYVCLLLLSDRMVLTCTPSTIRRFMLRGPLALILP